MKYLLVMPIVLILQIGSAFSQQNSVIQGTVVDSISKEPVEHAAVQISPGGVSVHTNEEGYFETPGLAEGAYTLSVIAPGFATYEMTVIAPSARLSIELTRRTYKLGPVVVTAQLAQERKSPVTFSNLEQSTIHDQFVTQDVPVLLSQLPSTIEYSENGTGTGYSYITIRGFDQSRISVMINGIPQNDPEDHNVYWIDVPDLQSSSKSIQVQRGAGSEFYGPPAIGGSVNLETSNFAADREINLSVGMGTTGSPGASSLGSPSLSSDGEPDSHNLVQKYSATLASGVFADRYSVYAHVSKTLSNGYRQDSWVNLDSYFLNATRYDENVTTEINIYGGPIADGLSYVGLPEYAALDKNLRTSNWDDWNADSNQVNYSPHMTRYVTSGGADTVYAVPHRSVDMENFSQPHVEFLNEWKLTPELTLNNSLFAVFGSGYFDYDGSWGDTTYFRITSDNGFHPVANPTDALIHAYEDLNQFGWLPRLTISAPSGTLVIGSELDRNLSDHWSSLRWADNLPADFPADFKYNEWHARTDVATIYGHELYSLNKSVTLMIDLEYEFKQYLFYGESFVGNQFTVPYHFLNPRFGVNYNLSSTSNFYASINRTSHEPQLSDIYNADESSGGETPHFALNPDSSLNFGKPLVTPETLYDLEAGYHFGDHDCSFGLSAYWMEFTDELISNGLLDQYGQPIEGNAKRTRHIGIEFEGDLKITTAISLYGNCTFSRNRLIDYTVFTDADGDPAPQGLSLDGNRIAGFPDFLANLRATYTDAGLEVVVLGQYVGSQYTDNFELADRMVDPYFVMNSWVSYRFDHPFSLSSIELKLYVNNLLDRLYIAHGEGIYFYPAAARNFFLNCSVGL